MLREHAAARMHLKMQLLRKDESMELDFLKELPSSIRKLLDEVSERISFSGDAFILDELLLPSTHLLNAKGKLLRPTLVLLGAYAIGENPAEFIDIAAAIELLHVSSLVHDDIIDKDKFRRSVQTVNEAYGFEAAILAGDALIAKAIQLAAKYGQKVIERISATAMEMCAGELLDYKCQSTSSDSNTYLKIARLKTASIIGAACSISGIYKGSSYSANLYDYGINAGIAFQIRDDMLDYGTENKAGNNVNIVHALASSGIAVEEAKAKAKKLNNSYIGKALESIEGMQGSSVLKRYAELIKL